MKKNFEYYGEFNENIHNKETNFYNYLYTNKIRDNEDNNKSIKEILKRRGEENLIIAPTGSGKTYSILTLSDGQLIFVVFTNTQAKQAASFYRNVLGIDCYAIVAGVNFEEIKEKMTNKTILIVVPELLLDAIDYFDIHNILIDEAHKLVSDACFRPILKNLEEKIREKANNITYMTATPDDLIGYLHFDNIYTYEQDNQDVFFNECRVVFCEDTFEKGLSSLIDKINGNAIIRLNSKKITKNLIFNKEKNGYDCFFINSDEKTIKFVNEETGEIEYDNTLTNYIINKSILPKGGEKTLYWTTMLCDEGINIEGVEGSSLEDLEAIYCIYLKSDANIDRIKQFFARLRGKYKRATILCKLIDKESEPFKELNTIYNNYLEAANETKAAYDNLVNIYKKIFGEKEALRQLKNSFNYKSINNEETSIGGSISIDDDFNVNINYKALYTYAYNTYQEQFFDNNNIDKLKELIYDDFKDDYILEASDEKIENTTLSRKEQKAILRQVEELPKGKKERQKFLKQFEPSFKDELVALQRFGFDEKDVINMMANDSLRIIEEKKKQVLFNNLREYFNRNEQFELINFLTNTDAFSRIGLHRRNLLLYQITQVSGLEKFLKNALDENINLKELFEECSTLDDLMNRVSLKQVVDNNIRYKQQIELLGGRAGQEQLFIIQNIGKYEGKDKVYLSKKKVEKLKKLMEKEFNCKYDINKIYVLIYKIFKISEDGRFNGLRTKF